MSDIHQQTVICLPTYNELENLPRITTVILETLPQASILVIDDNSPDGTGDLAEQMAMGTSRISVLRRARKEGLGRAYLNAFRILLDRPDVALIVQMDADFSHPPARLPQMIQAAEQADLVIGSRYVPGGGIRNWGIHRRLISRFGSLYARVWLSLPVRDLTGGFKVWRREMLGKVLQYPIIGGGYVFQAETTFLASRLGGRVTEMPIMFTDREMGISKMSAGIAFEASWRVPLIRWKNRDVKRDA